MAVTLEGLAVQSGVTSGEPMLLSCGGCSGAPSPPCAQGNLMWNIFENTDAELSYWRRPPSQAIAFTSRRMRSRLLQCAGHAGGICGGWPSAAWSECCTAPGHPDNHRAAACAGVP